MVNDMKARNKKVLGFVPGKAVTIYSVCVCGIIQNEYVKRKEKKKVFCDPFSLEKLVLAIPFF